MDSKIVINNKYLYFILRFGVFKPVLDIDYIFFKNIAQPFCFYSIYIKSKHEQKQKEREMKFLKKVVRHNLDGCTITKISNCIVEGG